MIGRPQAFRTSIISIICISFVGANLKVNRMHEGLTSVPTDIDTAVTILNLHYNNIESVDNESFVNYIYLSRVGLRHNPLKIIGEDTFAKNYQLFSLHMVGCQLESLPHSFGSPIGSITDLIIWNSVADPGILRGPYFRDFVSLEQLLIPKTALYSLEYLNLPKTIWKLDVGQTRLSSFPNVTARRLPVLRWLQIGGNNISNIPSVAFDSISDYLKKLELQDNGLRSVPDLASKPNLENIKLQGNNLETVPDLLSLNLKELKLAANPIRCDQRMCWWKMWHRLKSRPTITDGVTCADPPELTGLAFTGVNPRDMHCHKGNWNITLITRFIGPTWGPSGADRTQEGPMLAPWTLLSG